MLQKCPTISVNARSLLPFINEFVGQGLISQISIAFPEKYIYKGILIQE